MHAIVEADVSRRTGLEAPHMRRLVALIDGIRAESGRPVPDPDPADGGTEARLLLLLETPGPAVGSTGMVSRDNPAPTARNLSRFLDSAGIARIDTLIWNAVPFVIHAPGARNRAPRPAEIREGLRWLPSLLDLLPQLTVAVLAGRVAGQAFATLSAARPKLPVVEMPHPSPTIVCTSPAIPARIASALAEAATQLRGGTDA